jgi:hypothetical protein
LRDDIPYTLNQALPNILIVFDGAGEHKSYRSKVAFLIAQACAVYAIDLQYTPIATIKARRVSLKIYEVTIQ